MAKWLILMLVIGAGVCVFAGGLLYGVVTVGVPTPDGTPEVAAREDRDVGRSGVLMAAGLIVGVVGLVALAGVAIAQSTCRVAPDAEPGAAADRGNGVGLPGL